MNTLQIDAKPQSNFVKFTCPSNILDIVEQYVLMQMLFNMFHVQVVASQRI